MPEQEDLKLINLYRKFFSNTATLAELEEFSNLLDKDLTQEKLFRLLDTDFKLSESQLIEVDEFRSQQIFKNIIEQPQGRQTIIKVFPRIAIAASFIGALLIVSLYLVFNYFTEKETITTSIASKNDIPPGKTGATLILANGKVINLSEMQIGKIATESGVRISKSRSGEITYIMDNEQVSNGEGFNTLKTANAQTFRVKLPDGSTAWLNAASSIKFSSSFKNLKSRTVQLVGEAYFEVAKDENHPFIVKSANQEVQVLGTHFNVKAYSNDPRAITTLAEGRVKISYMASTWNAKSKIAYKDEVVLAPGQQSVLSEEKLNISSVDTDVPLAWKNGDFIFNGITIEEIMRDVSRWYNIEVIYPGEIPKGNFSGNVSRTKNISQILKALETTKLVHFKIEGRRVYVTN